MRTMTFNDSMFKGKLYVFPKERGLMVRSWKDDAQEKTFTINGRAHKVVCEVRESNGSFVADINSWNGIVDLTKCCRARRYTDAVESAIEAKIGTFFNDAKFMQIGKMEGLKNRIKCTEEYLRRDEANVKGYKEDLKQMKRELAALK